MNSVFAYVAASTLAVTPVIVSADPLASNADQAGMVSAIDAAARAVQAGTGKDGSATGPYTGVAVIRISPRDAADRLAIAQLPLDLMGEAESVGGVAEYLADAETRG